MRPTIYSAILVAVVVMTVGKTSVASNYNLKSIVKNIPEINLYKEYFEYAKAIMRQGIPALKVPPLDPYHMNVTLTYQEEYDVSYNFTNVTIEMNGLDVSEFSDFEVNIANLNLDDMSANLELYNYDIELQSYNLVASAVDSDGNLLQYNCSHINGDLTFNNFTSHNELELNGAYLHVKEFSMDYTIQGAGSYVTVADCNGDIALAWCVLDVVLYSIVDIADYDIPTYLKYVSEKYETILNDIFALRNITDDDDSGTQTNVQSKAYLDYMIETPDSHIGHGTLRRSAKRTSHQKSAKISKDNKFTMKWNM